MGFDCALLKNSSVLVIGDLMLDAYWDCEAIKISPEGPVPVLHVSKSKFLPGGAANVCANLAALGSKCTLLGLVGDDQDGQQLAADLDTLGVDTSLQTIPGYPTIQKLRITAQGQQIVRLDKEKRFLHEHAESLVPVFLDICKDYNAIVLSDYNKGTLAGIENVLVENARMQNKIVVVDPKGMDFSRYSGANVITPNRREFEQVYGVANSSGELLDKAINACHHHHFDSILVTLGADGVLLAQSDGTSTHIDTHAKEVYDVTGAGDTVVAVLAAFLSVGCDVSSATSAANLAASIAVSKHGAAAVSIHELECAAAGHKPGHSATKLQTLDALIRIVNMHKNNGRKIVMTNGCFDILHSGHVSYLEFAKQQGDVLIVAINDDDSVRRLKGDSRPINNLSDRSKILSALSSVDYVVGFSADTPDHLYKVLLPHVLVKGEDYRNKEIAGADHVLKSGGRICLASLVENKSSSSLIRALTDV